MLIEWPSTSTAEKIAVMQAFLDGKRIEFRSVYADWAQAENPTWDWSRFEFRVAPARTVQCTRYTVVDRYNEAISAWVTSGVEANNIASRLNKNGLKGPYNVATITWKTVETPQWTKK